jgi:hypothetical protein
VKERENFSALGRPWAAGHRKDGRGVRVEGAKRRGSQSHDRLRLKEFELPVEIRAAGTRCRTVESVTRRMALEDVEHSELRRCEAEAAYGGIEAAAGLAHERDSRSVLENSGRFPDEHEARGEASSVDNRLRARPAQRTELAGPDFVRKPLPLCLPRP